VSWGDRLIRREVDRAKADVKSENRQEREGKARDARRTEQPNDTPKGGKR
jgi:hypothetical protein